MKLRKRLYFKSIFIIVLFFVCSCAGPKKKVTFRRGPEEVIEPSNKAAVENAKKEVDFEKVEEKVIAMGGEKKEYPGIEGEFLDLPKLKDVYFAFDKYDLSKESRRTLAQNIKLLQKLPNGKIQIEGHCDERGSTEYNLTLGEKRANAVRKYIRSLNFPKHKMSTISYGEEMPVDPRHNEEAWSKNRRAHIIILTE